MGKLSTKNVKGTAVSTPKEIQPGNNTCKINRISLDDMKFKEGAKHITLHLETKPIGKDFEGFLKDKNNPESGTYKGQTGRVKSGEWAYSDGKTKGGKDVFRDDEILKFVKTLSVALGKSEWFEAQDDQHETIESLIEAFNKDEVYKDIYLNYCIAGKEYKNRQNFTTYELFLPKFSRDGASFESPEAKISKLIQFDQEKHIKKPVRKEVDEFATDTPVSDSTEKGFSLD